MARKKGHGQKKSARIMRHCFFSIMQCPAYTFGLATPLDAVAHYIYPLSLSLFLSPLLSLSSLTHTQWQEGSREDIIITIMLIMESGRKKGGQLSTKLNLFDYKEFNLWLVLLSESSVRNHPYLWMLTNLCTFIILLS